MVGNKSAEAKNVWDDTEIYREKGEKVGDMF